MLRSDENSRDQWNLGLELNKLREVGSLCDVALIGRGGTCVQAHKCVLAAASPTLCQLVVENTQLHNVICVEDYSADVISQLVSLIYLSDKTENISLKSKDSMQHGVQDLAKQWNCEFLIKLPEYSDHTESTISNKQQTHVDASVTEGQTEAGSAKVDGAIALHNCDKDENSSVLKNQIQRQQNRQTYPKSDCVLNCETEPEKSSANKQAGTTKDGKSLEIEHLYRVSTQKANQSKVKNTLEEILSVLKKDEKIDQNTLLITKSMQSKKKNYHLKAGKSESGITDSPKDVATNTLQNNKGEVSIEKQDIMSEEDSDDAIAKWKECKYCSQFKGKKKGGIAYHTEYCLKSQSCCEKCYKPFMSEDECASHHCRKKPLQHVCDMCGKVLVSKEGLRLHKQVHDGIKSKMCPFCGKRFQRSIQLQSHVKRVHGSERPFVCKHCQQSFALQFDLNRHVKVMHENPKKMQDKADQQSSFITINDLFACLYCGLVFTDQASLTKHEKDHNVEVKSSLPRLLPKEPEAKVNNRETTTDADEVSSLSNKDQNKPTQTKLRITQGEIVHLKPACHFFTDVKKYEMKSVASTKSTGVESKQEGKSKRKSQVNKIQSASINKKGPKKGKYKSQSRTVPAYGLVCGMSSQLPPETVAGESKGMAVLLPSMTLASHSLGDQCRPSSTTMPMDLSLASAEHKMSTSPEGTPSSQHSALMEESQTASSIWVSQFLDQHSIAANLAHAIEHDDDDMPLNLSYGQSSLPLSHTFGSFDSSVTMTSGSMVDEGAPPEVGTVESEVIYHSIMADSAQEDEMADNHKERLQALDHM